MKKAVYWTLGIVATLLLLLVGIGTHQWFVEKPFTLRIFLDREVIKLALASPQMKTTLGLHNLGIDEHNAHLDDARQTTILEKLPDLTKIKAITQSYQELEGQDAITQQATLYLLDSLIELEPYKYHNYPLDTFGGLQSQYPDYMSKSHPISSETDIKHYLARLSDSKRYFEQIIDAVEMRADRGIVPPAIVIENVTEQMQKFVHTPLDDNILLTSLKQRMSQLSSVTPEQQVQFYEQAKALVADVVYPAYYQLIDMYNQLLEKSEPGVGYWRLPDGENAYAALLRFFTTTDLTPDEVYQTGVDEVHRIQQRMIAILAAQGIDTKDGIAAAYASFLDNPALYYPDSQSGRTELINSMQQAIDELAVALPELFTLTDIPALKIERSPVLSEKTDTLARYSANHVYVNLSNLKALPKHTLPVLAYHEGIPGHHYESFASSQVAGIPIMFAEGVFGAYMEGWAMYAEQLPQEIGLVDSPEHELATLHYALSRAARMVIDTGIHTRRWSRQKAINYLVSQAAQSEEEAIVEVDRAIVVPGSGPMYKIGLMKIQALRAKMQHKLGDQFSLKAFHQALLGHGSLPLSLLEEVVEQDMQQ